MKPRLNFGIVFISMSKIAIMLDVDILLRMLYPNNCPTSSLTCVGGNCNNPAFFLD